MIYREIDPTNFTRQETFNFLHDVIVPRPVLLIATIDPEARMNLAPFSFFMAASLEPPMIALTVFRRADGSEKDTLKNIRSTGQFTVNGVDRTLLQRANACGADLPYGESEFSAFGIHPASCSKLVAPRVENAPFNLECKAIQIVEMEGKNMNSGAIVIGQIVAIHLKEGICKENGRLEVNSIDLAGRISLDEYFFVQNPFRLDRPKTGTI